jgi:hypothetical protein
VAGGDTILFPSSIILIYARVLLRELSVQWADGWGWLQRRRQNGIVAFLTFKFLVITRGEILCAALSDPLNL